MNTQVTSLTREQASHSSVFQTALSPETLRDKAPAAFASNAHERLSSAYTLISTERVLAALASAGFLVLQP